MLIVYDSSNSTFLLAHAVWVSQVYKNTGDFWFFFRTGLIPGIHHQNLFKSMLTLARVTPFEKEEERISIASDVVKVKGEDPATPGS